MSRLLPPERLALGVFAVLMATSFLYYPLYQAFWILGVAPIIVVWLVAVVLALFNLVFAFRDPYQSLSERSRAATAIPAAILAVMVIEGSLAIGSRTMASLHFATHSEEMKRAELSAGPGRPAAIQYVEGIPDGGLAIIRSSVRPTNLSQQEQVRLTGERIKGCRTIMHNAWLCSFD